MQSNVQQLPLDPKEQASIKMCLIQCPINVINVGLLSRLAGKSLLKMLKRWPSLISKCVLSLAENLKNPNTPEYEVLGSCAVLSTQTVLKHLTTVGFLNSTGLQSNFKSDLLICLFPLFSRIKRHSHHFFLVYFQGDNNATVVA